MGEENFYFVRAILNGYEAAILFYGDEKSVIEYGRKTLNSFSITEIPRQVASSLFELGMKCFYCLNTDIQEVTISSEIEEDTNKE